MFNIVLRDESLHGILLEAVGNSENGVAHVELHHVASSVEA